MLRNVFLKISKYERVFISSVKNIHFQLHKGPLSYSERWQLITGSLRLRYSERNIEITGCKLYAVAAEYPDINSFIEYFNLPDTFQTWFNMMCIHTWLLALRLEHEGVEGRIGKSKMMNIAYQDIEKRAKKMGGKVSKKMIKFFYGEMIYLMASFDEALLRQSDYLLADTLWCNVMNQFYPPADNDLERLEKMIAYIWKQIPHLNSLSSERFLSTGEVPFLPITSDRLNVQYANRRIQYCHNRPDDVVYI